MTKKYRSEHAEAVHVTMTDLFKSGSISAEKMREFDESCIVQEDKTPAKPRLIASGTPKKVVHGKSQNRPIAIRVRETVRNPKTIVRKIKREASVAEVNAGARK